jgi:citrate synthase
VEADRILVRGYAVDELMGRVPFGDAIYLLLTGELPSPSIARLVSAMLTGFIDHGMTPTSIATRHAARAGTSLPGAVATGLLGLDRPHTAGVGACRYLPEQGLIWPNQHAAGIGGHRSARGVVQADRSAPDLPPGPYD